MPSAWVHATIDLIAFGRHYFDLHREKDRPHETLGPEHRIVNHEWYKAFDWGVWTFSNPFPSWLHESIQALGDEEGPDRAEQHMGMNAHDYWDRGWDGLSFPERKYRESFFMWVLLHPELLKNWAGVDVVNGKIHRVIDGKETWEDCPEVRSEYRRLRKYVEAVRIKDKILQKMLASYG